MSPFGMVSDTSPSFLAPAAKRNPDQQRALSELPTELRRRSRVNKYGLGRASALRVGRVPEIAAPSAAATDAASAAATKSKDEKKWEMKKQVSLSG